MVGNSVYESMIRALRQTKRAGQPLPIQESDFAHWDEILYSMPSISGANLSNKWIQERFISSAQFKDYVQFLVKTPANSVSIFLDEENADYVVIRKGA